MKDTTLKPHSRVRFSDQQPSQGRGAAQERGTRTRRLRVSLRRNREMATRERRLAEFKGKGEPPPDQPVQVLCEDHSGTYQLPSACRFVGGEWRNNESGGTVEATVVGWRLPRNGNRAL